MGIFIKNMEMPKEERYVDVRIFADGRATTATGEHPFYREMDVIELPPHGDLISREWLIDIALHLMNIAKNDDIADGLKWLWQYIIEAPTTIESEE